MARYFGMAIAPWDVLWGGKFLYKKQVQVREKSGEGLRRMIGTSQTEDEVKMSETLGKMAAEHGIESVTTVALAYVMCKASNIFPINGRNYRGCATVLQYPIRQVYANCWYC